MLMGKVSERISMFWLDPSPGALVSFQGAMLLGLTTLLSVTGNAQSLLP
jgi:hypothetical protein